MIIKWLKEIAYLLYQIQVYQRSEYLNKINQETNKTKIFIIHKPVSKKAFLKDER